MKVIKLLHHVIRGAGNCSTFTQTKFITNSKVIKAPWSEKNVIAGVFITNHINSGAPQSQKSS
jgi:hypothetical protein